MKNKKMNNKGFSLVELIIVIAIMAILVGVLAPVYTQYVERTRKSSDVNGVADIATAMETTLIDFSSRGVTGSITATIPADGTAVTFTSTDTGTTTMADAVEGIIGTGFHLTANWSSTTNTSLVATIDTNGSVTYTVTASSVVAEMMAEYPALNDKLD